LIYGVAGIAGAAGYAVSAHPEQFHMGAQLLPIIMGFGPWRSFSRNKMGQMPKNSEGKVKGPVGQLLI